MQIFAHDTLHGTMADRTKTTLVTVYNLDVIISVGYRVKSIEGTRFRQWATLRLREILLSELAKRMRIRNLEDRVGRVEDEIVELREGVCEVLKEVFAPDTPSKRNRIGFCPEADAAGKPADGERGDRSISPVGRQVSVRDDKLSEVAVGAAAEMRQVKAASVGLTLVIRSE